MKAFWKLFTTETKLALRGGDMLIFGIAMPLGIMLLMGYISSPQDLALSFGGIATVGICASGLMGIPLTFSSYRHAKILKRFRVTPVSPSVLLGANALLQTIFAWVSALGVYLIAHLAFDVRIAASPLRFIATFLFVQGAIYSLGFLIASLAPNERTVNWACTLAYFPALFLSGGTVPFEILPRGLQAFASAFPTTQGILLLKNAVLGQDPGQDALRFLALGVLSGVSYILAVARFRWE